MQNLRSAEVKVAPPTSSALFGPSLIFDFTFLLVVVIRKREEEAYPLEVAASQTVMYDMRRKIGAKVK